MPMVPPLRTTGTQPGLPIRGGRKDPLHEDSMSSNTTQKNMTNRYANFSPGSSQSLGPLVTPHGREAIVFGSIFAWRRSFPMQSFDMSDQLRLTGPPAEVETEHLIGAFGRRAPDPQADQQAAIRATYTCIRTPLVV